MKKLSAVLFAVAMLSASLSATATVSITGAVIADYRTVPTLDQALASPFGERAFKGFEWGVAIDRFGFGGTYAVDFSKDSLSSWWLDWYGVPLFVGYHLFGTGGFVDPFVEAGIGCAGRVFTSSGTTADPRLLISLFPSLTAGLALDFKPLLLGAKLSWVPGISEIPCTPLLGYPLGGAQIVFTLGYRIGGRD
jgi:hypothetical protein